MTDARRWWRAGNATSPRARRGALWAWPAAAAGLLGLCANLPSGVPAHEQAPARPLGAAVAPASIATAKLPTVAVQGPGDALYVYWQTSDAQWHGPTSIGTADSTPSIAMAPNGLPTVAVQGPGNSLYVYWEASNTQWYGPLAVGTAFSAPAIAMAPNGLPTIAVQGPGNSLYVYWQAANSQWYGPLGAGGDGSTDAAPAIAIGPSGLPTVAVQGPNGSTFVYWEAANAQWYGPLGVGGWQSDFAAPAVAIGPSGLPTVAVQGPNGSTFVYWEAANAQWYGPLGVGGWQSDFAAPAVTIGPSGLPTVATEGPGNSLYVYWQAANAQWYGPLAVGGGGSTYSPPAMAINPNGLPTIEVQGPGDAPWLYWEASNAQWYGPLGLAAEPPATVPAGSPYFTFTASLSEGGSGTGYAAYIDAHDASNDALSVGIQTDATDPTSQGRPYFIWELVQNGAFTYQYLNQAPAGFNSVTLSWWPASQTAVFYEGSTPVADIHANFTPRMFFSIEGDGRVNGDSVNDTFQDAQITAGSCPSTCGLNGSWNTSSFNYYGLRATDTNGQAQNGANFTVTGTVAGLPPGGNWDSNEVAGIAMIAQYWYGQ